MKLWRDHKSLLLKDVMKQAEEVGLPHAAALLKPDNVDSMDKWLTFLKSKTIAEFRVSYIICEVVFKVRV